VIVNSRTGTVVINDAVRLSPAAVSHGVPGGANLSEIVDALNMLGVGAGDLVVILEALKQAGALQAEMVVL
jgi:flagellar P-ring protein FlgI